ncbi:MAG TPA: monovalent cation/H+ antiporter complex subunit F [Gaiellaceae bacterium]
MNAFLVAATVLLATLAPLLVLASLRRPIDGLVALETAGAVTTLVLLCLSVGLGESIFFTVALIAVVASWIGGFVYVRFLGRWT